MSFDVALTLVCVGCVLLLMSGCMGLLVYLVYEARAELHEGTPPAADPGGEWTADRERRFMVWALREGRQLSSPPRSPRTRGSAGPRM